MGAGWSCRDIEVMSPSPLETLELRPGPNNIAPMFLTEADKQAIKASWRLVIPIKDTAAELFYRRLFELKPDYRKLFNTDMAVQRNKLMGMLGFIVKALDWPDSMWQEEVDHNSDLFLVVLALGRRHSHLYGIPEESYVTVREALLFALDFGLGQAFDPATRAAWERMYDIVSLTMKMGVSSVDMGKPQAVTREEHE